MTQKKFKSIRSVKAGGLEPAVKGATGSRQTNRQAAFKDKSSCFREWTTERLWASLLNDNKVSQTVSEKIARLVDYYATLDDFPWDSLVVEWDIDPETAHRVGVILELAGRLAPRNLSRPTIRMPEDILSYANSMKYLQQEHLRGLYLDARHRIKDDRVISIGTANMSLAHPREVLAPALEVRATAFVLVHNHPSGSSEPSPEDHRITRQLVQCARFLDIAFLDHIIVAGDNGYSFRASTPYWETSPTL